MLSVVSGGHMGFAFMGNILKAFRFITELKPVSASDIELLDFPTLPVAL